MGQLNNYGVKVPWTKVISQGELLVSVFGGCYILRQ